MHLVFQLNAQTVDLLNLSLGEIEMFTPIYEQNKEVCGYFSLFKLEELSESKDKYKYVVLDKHLNEVTHGEFIDTAYKGVVSKYFQLEKVDNSLLLTKRYGVIESMVVFNASRLLHLDNTKINAPFYFEENTLHTGFRDSKRIKKTQLIKKYFSVPIVAKDGYVVIQVSKMFTKKNTSYVHYYNLNNEKIWDYHFDGDIKKSKYKFKGYQDDGLYFEYITKESRARNIKVLQLDVDSGKLNFSYELEHSNSKYSYSYKVENKENKTILTGKISPYSLSGYDINKGVGLFKIVLDKDGNELFKKHFLWEEVTNFIEVSENGKLEDRYKLFAHSIAMLNDERIIVVSEKFKITTHALAGGHIKTDDFIIMEFDDDFHLKKVETINKNTRKFSTSDFLYSQYINNKRGIVFFYRDYLNKTKGKNKDRILGVVSIIKGKVLHNKIPMLPKNSAVNYEQYMAKEGYILVRELNKKLNLDQIRLESINHLD